MDKTDFTKRAIQYIKETKENLASLEKLIEEDEEIEKSEEVTIKLGLVTPKGKITKILLADNIGHYRTDYSHVVYLDSVEDKITIEGLGYNKNTIFNFEFN